MSDPVTDATQIIRDLLEDDLFARVPYESPERIDTTAALAALAVLENAANDAAPKNSVEWMLVVKDERDRADDAEARAETLTQDLEEAHVLVVTASVAFGSPVCDEAPQELWDKAHVRGWVVTEQDFTGDYQTRMTGEGERALAAALAAPATPTGADDAAA